MCHVFPHLIVLNVFGWITNVLCVWLAVCQAKMYGKLILKAPD